MYHGIAGKGLRVCQATRENHDLGARRNGHPWLMSKASYHDDFRIWTYLIDKNIFSQSKTVWITALLWNLRVWGQHLASEWSFPYGPDIKISNNKCACMILFPVNHLQTSRPKIPITCFHPKPPANLLPQYHLLLSLRDGLAIGRSIWK